MLINGKWLIKDLLNSLYTNSKVFDKPYRLMRYNIRVNLQVPCR